ncbi:MAG: phosphoenolpyruvate synthase [Ilumatobacteraceae bacterium]|nr:phosphoenolpyruvate synthase [Ilumatobacteraceae bacterium]
MSSDVRSFEDIDRTQVPAVGGKGANLGELARMAGMDGVVVPSGFCITTDVFEQVLAAAGVERLLGELAAVSVDDRPAIAARSAEVRTAIGAVPVPDDVAAEVAVALDRLGSEQPVAVRSSATAEDLPTASFAGQHDSFLGVAGLDAVLAHVRRCWASLFTDRAVAYRMRNGIDHRQVRMGVVVQTMADPIASGVMFTAHPVNGDRTVVSIDAVLGLGEALVSGQVDPEAVAVRDGRVVSRSPGSEALTERQAVDLAALGRRIEAHFGSPQDIEWCREADGFVMVQSRPITTLFPIPTNAGDGVNHVYVSVGHQQMMTDPLRPFGLSFHQRIAGRPMFEAGGRLFVDVTMALASPTTQAGILDALGTSDPLIGGALQAIVDREGFLPPPPADTSGGAPVVRDVPLLPADPAAVAALIARSEASVARLTHDIAGKEGSELLDFIEGDIVELKAILTHPDSRPVLFSGFGAALWLNDHMLEWFGERNVIDVLSRSAPGNVTAEMGLALLDVADVIRPLPEVVAFLRTVDSDGFLDDLAALPGGEEAREAIEGFLDRYGMRCIGEIDITQPRWSEQPTALVPVILADVDGFDAGEAERRFERGRLTAETKAAEILDRVRALPDGEAKAIEAEAMIARVRAFAGYREYPKYGYISRFGIYKQALVAEADRLVAAGVLRERDDAWFLRFEELQEVVRAGAADLMLIDERKAAHEANRSLTPPRVLTSDGEVVAASYGRDAPEGALIGLPVSAGVVEGRARVIHTMAEADIGPGDILVTTGTDPSWSPVFVAIAGLVTEVGGLMTHGAVIAREYGLPAVVGVERATELIRDGQHIRVDATDGTIELLD